MGLRGSARVHGAGAPPSLYPTERPLLLRGEVASKEEVTEVTGVGLVKVARTALPTV